MPRGRPRQFDEQRALSAAMQVFWERGLAATSLDDLARAMAMNRPSIYNAFGNKEALYRTCLANFLSELEGGLTLLLASEDVREGFSEFFEQAIHLYCGQNPPLGCLIICTAPSASRLAPDVAADFARVLQRIDCAFGQRLQRAMETDELQTDAAEGELAMLLQAVLQTLALRARAGESPNRLRSLAAVAVERLLPRAD